MCMLIYVIPTGIKVIYMLTFEFNTFHFDKAL